MRLRQPLGNLIRSCVALHGPAVSVARTGSVTRRRRRRALAPVASLPASLSLSRPARKAAATPLLRAGLFVSGCVARHALGALALAAARDVALTPSPRPLSSRLPLFLPVPPPERARPHIYINELADAITPRRRRRRQQLLPPTPAAGATGPGRGFKKAAGAPVQDEAHVLPHGQGRAAREAAGARVRGELL